MKVFRTAEPPMAICAQCQTRYDPQRNRATCQHTSLEESAMLKAIRENGRPYKIEPWTIFDENGEATI